MATPIQSVTIKTITTSPTTLQNLNSISILNGNATNSLTIGISGSANVITLTSGQSVTLQASTGFVLPDLTITGTGLSANIVTT
jgi:hypothetical protein